MSAFIIQNDKHVSQVKPGTPIQLFANNVPLFPGITGFLVVNTDGQIFLDQNVNVNMMGNAWLDWTAPTEVGNYTFYANSSELANNFTTFKVSSNAPNPEDQGKINWWMIGGIAAGAVALIALLRR